MPDELTPTHPTGWHAVVEVLRAAGVGTLFGLPDDELTLLAALEDEPVRMVLCRDQRNAVFMTAGHAITTGRPAYCVVGRGPAVGSAVAGLVEAATGRVPLVLLATGTDARRIGTGAFQELDQLALVRPVVKWAVRVEDPALLAGTLEKAALVAAAGAPGPVYVEIPATVGTSPAPRTLPNRYAPNAAGSPGSTVPPGFPSPGLRAGSVPTAVDRARRPLLLVGGGMRHRNADGVVERFAEWLGAGMVVTASGRGTVDERHPLFCGVAGLYATGPVRDLWRDADTVVALGSRLEETAVDGWELMDPSTPVVQVNLEPGDLSPHWSGPKVLADAATTIADWVRHPRSASAASAADSASADSAAADSAAAAGWLDRVDLARRTAMAVTQSRGKQLRAAAAISVLDVLDALDGAVPRDRILVQENGLADMWSYFWPYWTCHSRGGSVVPSEQTSLGFGAAAAVGVALAAPDRPVVALVGDGAFNLFRCDLDTAAGTGAGILYLVLDNGGYGWLQHQLTSSTPGSRFHFAGPDAVPADAVAPDAAPADAGPHNEVFPDGASLGGTRPAAERGGVAYRRVTRKADLAAALAAAWARCADGRTTVVEVAVRLADIPPCLWQPDTSAGPARPDELDEQAGPASSVACGESTS